MDTWFKTDGSTDQSGKDTLNLMVIVKLVIHMGKNTIESLSLAMYNIHPEVGYRIKYKRKH